MGVEYNHLGEEYESIKESHKRGILYGLGQQSRIGIFWAREREGELGVGATMEGEF